MQSFAVPFIRFHGHCAVISSPETRPFIRQTLEIGMDRSGGINSFFTLRPRHPDHGFQHHPGSAITEAGRKRRRALSPGTWWAYASPSSIPATRASVRRHAQSSELLPISHQKRQFGPMSFLQNPKRYHKTFL